MSNSDIAVLADVTLTELSDAWELSEKDDLHIHGLIDCSSDQRRYMLLIQWTMLVSVYL